MTTSYLLCYICGNKIGDADRIERLTRLPDSNGLGAVEACHEHCDRERLTELQAPLVDLGVPLKDEPK